MFVKFNMDPTTIARYLNSSTMLVASSGINTLALTESHCNTLITQQTDKQHESEQDANRRHRFGDEREPSWQCLPPGFCRPGLWSLLPGDYQVNRHHHSGSRQRSQGGAGRSWGETCRTNQAPDRCAGRSQNQGSSRPPVTGWSSVKAGGRNGAWKIRVISKVYWIIKGNYELTCWERKMI